MAETTLTPEQTQALLQELINGGKQLPAKLGDLELVLDPTTKNPIAYRDPNTGNTIAIPQPSTTKPATPAAGLERLDANLQPLPAGSTAQPVYVRDPNAPAGTQPFKVEQDDKLGDPSTWTPMYDPNDTSQVNRRVIGLYSPSAQKVAASVTAAPGAKPSDPSTWTPVYRTPGDAKSGVVGQWDPVNKELHAVSQAADGKQIVTTPTAIYNVDKDSGTITKLTDITPNAALQVVTYPDGTIYTFNPNEKDPTKQLQKVQGGHPPATISDQKSGITYVYDEATHSYAPAPGIPTPKSVDQNTQNLRRIILRDADGNVVSDSPNPNYNPSQTTQGAQSASARMIQQWNADKGQWEWVENKGRVTASEALRSMATQLSGQVVAGDISQDEAVQIINAANAKMTNDINQQTATREAATGALTGVNNAAQIGAGLLQNRVTSASNLMNQFISSIGSNKNLMSWPSGLGENMTAGMKEWVTGLGGGQPVYDAAAAMVNQANPAISGNPTVAQQAYTALRGLMDLHQAQTGQPAVPQDGQPRSQAGFAAPNTVVQPPTTTPFGTQDNSNFNPQLAAANQPNAFGYNPQASTAAMNAAGMQDTAQNRQPASVPAPVLAVPGQNYGANVAYTGGIAPWNAQPQPIPALPIPAYTPYRAPVTV